MTPDTIFLCKRYLWNCEDLFDLRVPIDDRIQAAERVIELRTRLNAIFARQFEYAEMQTHCTQIVAAWEQLAA